MKNVNFSKPYQRRIKVKKRFLALTVLVLMGTALFGQTFKLEIYDDGNGSSISVKETTETINGKPTAVWVFAGTLAKAKYPYAGCKIIPDAATLSQFRNAKGVGFMASGDGRKYRVKVVTPGGEGNHHEEQFTAAKGNGKEIKAEFGKMKQQPFWGEKKNLVPGGIEEFEFQFASNGAVDHFEFKVWGFKPLN
jgi:hypothetical protein